MNLGTCIIVGIVAGIGASAGYVAWSWGDEGKLSLEDLMPMPPPNPPVPRIIYEKPELFRELVKRTR